MIIRIGHGEMELTEELIRGIQSRVLLGSIDIYDRSVLDAILSYMAKETRKPIARSVPITPTMIQSSPNTATIGRFVTSPAIGANTFT